MEPLRSDGDRNLLEPCTEFDPATAAGLSPAVPLTIRSLSIFEPPVEASSHVLIFVGTGGGKILLLSLNPNDSRVEFLNSASVSNRVIDSILVLEEIGRILVLSEGFLFLIDLFLLQPSRKIGGLKGVTAFSKRVHCSDDAADKSVDLFENDAAVKLPRKTFLQKWANGTGARVLETKIEEGAGCYVAAAAGKALVLMKLVSPIAEVPLDSELGGISISWKEIQGVEAVKTMTWLGDSVILGTSDGYTLFSATSGKSTPIFSLPEASGPPRLKCLRRSKEVMLLVDNVGVMANEAGQPVGGSLIFRYAPESVVEMGCYVIVGRDGRLDLYSRKSGIYIQSLSVAKGNAGPCILASNDQGNGVVVGIATAYKNVWFGVSILSRRCMYSAVILDLDPMVICYRKVSAEEQIKGLLRKKNFKEAICLVEEFESEGEISREMLSFVHAQVGLLLLFDLHFEDAVNHFLLSEAMQPSEIFPFIMRDPNRWSHLVPRNRYWGLHPPPVPLEQVVDDGLMAIQRAIFLRKAGVDTTANEAFLLNPPSRAELLKSAIENIIRYLCVSREKDLISPVKEGVDTLLMYLYRALNRVEDMERLASSPNSCIVEELETLLDDSGHLRTLAFLYASKGMCSKALVIWRRLARNYSTGLWKDAASLVEYNSLDNSGDLISGEKSAAMEASKLLQESSDQDLVLEHLGWIADIDEELAVMVLTSEKRAIQLSPEEVLAAVDPKKVEIQQRYLQWLIEDQDSDETRYHTLYALSLAKSALETAGTHRCSVRERLRLFLQASDLYDPEDVLYVIEGSELWLEKAILYRKMGQEILVLQILALKLEDSEAAEQYCAEIGRSDAYMQLLDMYLDPQDGKEPMFKAAVRLLHNHGESLDPLQVLEKLSPEMPLQLASDTILRMLRARVHHHRQGQIVHNLSRAIDLDARSARLEERSRHVQINDESTCDSCHARLGTKLFAMYPDDSVVCYKCYRRQGESTSVRGHNFKHRPIFKPGWLVTRSS